MGKFREIIEKSKKIVITSHYGPDADAVGSSLGLYTVLKNEYPEKEFSIVLNGEFGDFADNYVFRDEILNDKPSKVIRETEPDLVIFTDATEIKRFEQLDPEALQDTLDILKPVMICIDHHEFELQHSNKFEFYINKISSSASEEVLNLLLSEGYFVPKEVCLMILVGMIADTGRFLYPNRQIDQTLQIIKHIFSTGITMQDGQDCLDTIKEIHIKILGKLLDNVEVYDGFVLSSLSDVETEEFWKQSSAVDFGRGTHMYINSYAKAINGVGLGVLVHKDMVREGYYKGSFRSTPISADCVVLTQTLGGGGHKTAAGFRFEASSLEEAKNRIKHVIDEKGLLG
jgi:bifunctional oligoribonuclease and PAP phosphatase NrnA